MHHASLISAQTNQHLVRQMLGMSHREIENLISVAIDFLDIIQGHCDLEEDDPPESDGDDQDYAWLEFGAYSA